MVEKIILQWNGKSIIRKKGDYSSYLRVYTDSSKKGMGAYFANHWFSVAWPSSFQDIHINVLEMVAVAAALLSFFRHNSHLNVLLYSDNKDVVDIWYSGSTTNKKMMSILRFLPSSWSLFLVIRMLAQTLCLAYR